MGDLRDDSFIVNSQVIDYFYTNVCNMICLIQMGDLGVTQTKVNKAGMQILLVYDFIKRK